MAKYDAEKLRQMAASGQAMKDGSYPIGDTEDLSNAIHAVGRGGADHDTIRAHIIRRAKAMGQSAKIPDNWNSDGSLTSGRSASTTVTPYTRSFALDDISIRAGGDGRTVDAYATVFDVAAKIHDQDGDYEEVNDRAMYNRAVADAAPAGGRKNWKVGVFYNHGMTIYQTPSDLYSMPVGVPLEIKPDGRGLFTRTRYMAGQVGDLIVDGIKEGLLTTYSVSGAYTRSDPPVPRGGFKRGGDGQLRTVRRLESTLREYGPTPFPAYPEAEIVGMRAEWAAMLLSSLAPGERERLAAIFASGAPLDSPAVDASDDSELVAEDSRRHEAEMRSGRSPKEELELQSARFILRQRELQAQRARSIVSQGENNG
jgi:phage head maturation protease